MENASQTERLLNLVCVLLTSEIGMTKQEIYQAVRGYQQKAGGNPESLIKLFERDKDLIRDYGVQLVSDREENHQNARYKIADGEFQWPRDLELTGRQLELLELAAMAWSKTSIKNWADFGLIKLRALGHNVDHSIIGIAPRITIADQNFEILSEAISNKSGVSFEYKKLDASESESKMVSPARIRNIEGEWVLLAKDMATGVIKNYLLRRITSQATLIGEFAEVSGEEISEAEANLERFIEENIAVIWIREDSEAEFRYGTAGEIQLNFMDEELLAEDILDLAGMVSVVSPATLAARVERSIQKVIADHA